MNRTDKPPKGHEAAFRAGLRAMREMLARQVEQSIVSNTTLAQKIRATWNPSWGDDPGTPEIVEEGYRI
jgi:hypothetical protein